MKDQVFHSEQGEAGDDLAQVGGLARVDAMLHDIGAAARAQATPERLARIGAATAPRVQAQPLTLVGCVVTSPRPSHRRTTSGLWLTGTRLAAALGLVMSVGAVILATRSPMGSDVVPTVVAAEADAETDFAMLDALFDGSGPSGDPLASMWSDARSLDDRVSADWGSDDLFGTDDSQQGDSM